MNYLLSDICSICAIWMITVMSVHEVHAQYGTYSFSLVGKPTNQSSLYLGLNGISTSDKAVDGNTNNMFSAGSCSCTEPNNKNNPWWGVDLEDFVTVFSITLTNRGDCCDYRLNQFSVYGSNETIGPPNEDNTQQCYTFRGEFGNGARTFYCTTAIKARYLIVTITEPDDYNKKILTLCEVQIQAVCPDGTYGENCAGTCSTHCVNPPCDKFTASGICPVRPTGTCTAGYKGDNCTTPCEPGSYGMDCANVCTKYCKSYHCDIATGRCPGGLCNAGYQGEFCDKQCEYGQYGENCVNSCSAKCKLKSCNKTNGACLYGECLSGYHGDMCQEDCPLGTYGDRCRFNCSPNCRNQCISTSEIGKCKDGCVAGYTGTTCELECSYNTFGQNCHPCSPNCDTLPCDKLTGECPQGKCGPGFIGFNCTQECPHGRFGVKCLSECFPNCKDTCHHVDGSCRAGCEEGWTGEKCDFINKGSPSGVIIGLAVLVTVLGVLCIVSITVLVMKQHKAKQKDALAAPSQEPNQASMYVNVANDPATNKTEKNLTTEIKYEDVSLDIHNGRNEAGPYEKLDSLEVQRDLHQPYQELRK